MGNTEQHGRDNLSLGLAALREWPGRGSRMIAQDDPIIFIVDDDYRMREALSSFVESMGFRTASFGSGCDFLEADRPDSPACLILDLELPDISGLELQQELADKNAPPVIFVT